MEAAQCEQKNNDGGDFRERGKTMRDIFPSNGSGPFSTVILQDSQRFDAPPPSVTLGVLDASNGDIRGHT